MNIKLEYIKYLASNHEGVDVEFKETTCQLNRSMETLPNYFSRYQSDFCGETGSEDNKEFAEYLQEAVRSWQSRNNRSN